MPSVSEQVGGTGLRSPPLAGATFETKRPGLSPKPPRANDEAAIANYPAKCQYRRKQVRVPAVAEGLPTLCVSLVSPVSRLILLHARLVIHFEASLMG